MNLVLEFALRMYKRWISPMLPHSCRFVPTCSEYAMEAIKRHGAIRGSALAIGRLLRCRPFARAGYDPVPGVEQAPSAGSGQAFRPASRTEAQISSGAEVL